MKRLLNLLVVLAAALAVAGCNEPKKPEPKQQPQVVKKESTVVVPPAVKGKWKAVKIEITDKISKKSTVLTVGIGSKEKIPGSDLTIEVENFLPHFVMEGTTLTSESNDLKNPAVQMRISQGGKEIYKGWLFKLFPTIHAFQHPQYGFALVGYIPA
ncbi:DUF2155 domain-containing protein [Geomesophilobacter sediminis]|uniref:DUF2155 domain-containing protein n=1 Tax=Geomesophilobacter sediminis TaxID=2798584 RepID=A0A8J7JMM2_9BACT|nr:DUF2155 domain-containing protein [Geomesophilobacter sediminis]MBJ6726120.1 DUF2155 domain-containing protein [Geomesophilobacter sediminis]